MFKLLRKMFGGAIAREFNDGYVIGYDHGHADGHADGHEREEVRVEAVRQAERDALTPRISYAEGWRYGALFAQQNTSLGAPAIVADEAYAKGWFAGFDWFRASTKGMVWPS